MSVDVLDRDDRFVNGLALAASVLDPSRDTRRVALEQIAPGRYRGEFPVPRAGRYYITLSGRDGEMQVGPKTFGLAVPYSPEYLDLGVNQALLRDIAGITGGRVLPLSAASLSVVTAPAREAPGLHARVWWPFFLAALVLLVAEVAVRRVVLPDAWRARWARWRGAERDAEARRRSRSTTRCAPPSRGNGRGTWRPCAMASIWTPTIRPCARGSIWLAAAADGDEVMK